MCLTGTAGHCRRWVVRGLCAPTPVLRGLCAPAPITRLARQHAHDGGLVIRGTRTQRGVIYPDLVSVPAGGGFFPKTCLFHAAGGGQGAGGGNAEWGGRPNCFPSRLCPLR